MARKRKTPFPIDDDVDRALLQVHRAACKLAMIAGASPGTGQALKAAEALRDLGSLAGPPVAASIEHIPSEARRLLMLTALREIPPILGFDIYTALLRIGANDPSESVRAAAAEASETLRLRSHERFRRLAAVAARQQEIVEQECAAKAKGG